MGSRGAETRRRSYWRARYLPGRDGAEPGGLIAPGTGEPGACAMRGAESIWGNPGAGRAGTGERREPGGMGDGRSPGERGVLAD